MSLNLLKKRKDNARFFSLTYDLANIYYLLLDSAKFKPLNLGEVKLPDGTVDKTLQILSPELFASALKEIVTKNNLSKSVYIGLPLQAFDLFRLKLPKLPLAELSVIINDEAQRESLLRMSGQEIRVAFDVLNEFEENGVKLVEILVKAISCKLYDDILAAFSTAGIEVIGIEANVIALQKTFAHANPGKPVSDILLNTTEDYCEFTVWQNNHLKYWRHIPFGQGEREKLRDEIGRSLERYWTKFGRDIQFKKMLCYGSPLFFADMFGIGVENIAFDYQIKPELLGLSIKKPVSIYSQGFIQKQDERKLTWLNDVAVGVLLLTIGLIVFSYFKLNLAIKSTEKNINDNKKIVYQVSELEVKTRLLKAKNKALSNKISVALDEYSKVNEKPFFASDLFYQLLFSLNEGISLSNVKVNTSGNIEVIGRTLDEKNVLRFLNSLQDNNYFQDVYLSQLQNSPAGYGKHVWDFAIELNAVGAKTED